jgi:hypothetical protein
MGDMVLLAGWALFAFVALAILGFAVLLAAHLCCSWLFERSRRRHAERTPNEIGAQIR